MIVYSQTCMQSFEVQKRKDYAILGCMHNKVKLIISCLRVFISISVIGHACTELTSDPEEQFLSSNHPPQVISPNRRAYLS